MNTAKWTFSKVKPEKIWEEGRDRCDKELDDLVAKDPHYDIPDNLAQVPVVDCAAVIYDTMHPLIKFLVDKKIGRWSDHGYIIEFTDITRKYDYFSNRRYQYFGIAAFERVLGSYAIATMESTRYKRT